MTKKTLNIIMGKLEILAKLDLSEYSADSKVSVSPAGLSIGLASIATTSVSKESASQVAQTVLAAIASKTRYSIDNI